MSDLLEKAVTAHGGMDRWNSVTSIDVAASIMGATWFVKGKGDALKYVRFAVDTTRGRLTMDFVVEDKHVVDFSGEAAEGDVSRSHQKPYPRIDLVLWRGRAAAPPGLHRRHPGPRTR